MVDVRSDRPDSPGEGSCQSISRDRDYGYHEGVIERFTQQFISG